MCILVCNRRHQHVSQLPHVGSCPTMCQEDNFSPKCSMCNTRSRVNDVLELVFIYCSSLRIIPEVVAEVLRELRDF